VQQNSQSAVLFAILGLFSAARHYLNGALLLRAYEHDYFSEIIPYSKDGASEEDMKRRKRSWEKKSRMYNMLRIGNATRHFWIVVFCVCVIFFILVVLLYVGSMNLDGFKSNKITPVEGYEYERNPNLPYPTCVLRVTENDLLDGDLFDYAFIANVAYMPPDEAQTSLNRWFGDDVARVNDALVEEFREAFDFEAYGMSRNSPVSYKLVQSVVDPSYVMITIRGTATIGDVLADAQLWISAMLFQGVRYLLPLGDAFTPILHHLVNVVQWVETGAIARVAYYQETREFALYLMEEGYKVRVTG
jgi:lipase ATG15